jgi:hypothetical protein
MTSFPSRGKEAAASGRSLANMNRPEELRNSPDLTKTEIADMMHPVPFLRLAAPSTRSVARA